MRRLLLLLPANGHRNDTPRWKCMACSAQHRYTDLNPQRHCPKCGGVVRLEKPK